MRLIYRHILLLLSSRSFGQGMWREFAAVAVAFVLTLGVCLSFSACSSDSDRVSALIAQAARDPELRNEQTFNELSSLILARPEKYKGFLTPSGGVDVAKLQAAYDAAAGKGDGDSEWNLSEYGGALSGDLRLRLMLERSGSMTGYDRGARSTGDFKRVLSEMITRFPGRRNDDGSILIVNDGLYDYPGTFDTFLQDKDIFSSTASIGNPAFTDFRKIFENSLTDTVPERVTVLVTDLIYSPRGAAGMTAEKIFNEEGALASYLFEKHLDKSMLIVRLSSDFSGTYYPYADSKPFQFNGQRPYYLIITGSAAAMSRLRGSDKYASFTDFRSLPGYEQQYFFNRRPLPLKWWSLMPRANATQGDYTLAGGDSESGAHSLKDARPARDTGEMLFTVAADMSGIPAEADYLLDKSNYRVDSDAPVEILEIKAADKVEKNPRNQRYLKRATHLITLRLSGKSTPDDVKVTLLNRLPDWVKQGSSKDDRSPYGSFASRTFGLEPFLQGVYNAYYGTAAIPAFTSFDIKFTH